MYLIVRLLFFTKLLLHVGLSVDSKNHKETDFGILAEMISFWNNMGYTIYDGGDFNARLCDLNVFSENIFHWRYERNVDSTINSYGKKLRIVCEHNSISPLNH